MSKRLRQAALDEVNDMTIETFMCLFQGLEAMVPKMADRYRADYQEFMQQLQDLMKSDQTYTLGGLYSRIPDNKWVRFLIDVVYPAMPTEQPKVTEAMAKNFKDAVRKRVKERHTQ